MKQCSKCKELKPRIEFYKDSRTKDGLKSQCKKCHCYCSVNTRDKEKHRLSNKLYMRRLHQKNTEKVREYWRNHKETDKKKLHARSLLNSAVKHGKMQKPEKCQECGTVGIVYGHHEDYSKPLSVDWLCADCHGKRHRKTVTLGVGN